MNPGLSPQSLLCIPAVTDCYQGDFLSMDALRKAQAICPHHKSKNLSLVKVPVNLAQRGEVCHVWHDIKVGHEWGMLKSLLLSKLTAANKRAHNKKDSDLVLSTVCFLFYLLYSLPNLVRSSHIAKIEDVSCDHCH